MMDRITLNNRYQIIEKIGGGGMAEVFHGYDTYLNRDVAIKILRDQYIEDTNFIERFRQEACSAANLLHPNIVNVYDVGSENNFYYIVMEYVVGPTLKEYITQKGYLDPREALHIAAGIASGLIQAHIHNVVHCDIKSHNILVDQGGSVKITDFGIAKMMNEVSPEKAKEVVGSVYYLSPEQACGKEVTPQSDLYSLGIVLFEMLTGKLPFEADTPMKVALQHVEQTIPSLKALKPDLPGFLDKIVTKALAKKPEFRYKSAQEFLADIKHAEELLGSTENNRQEDTVKFVSVEAAIPEVGVNEETMVLNKDDVLDKLANYKDPQEEVPVEKKRINPGKLVFFLIVGLLVLVIGGYGINEISKPEIVVPDLTGKTIVEAEDILTDLKLTYSLAEEYNTDVTSGKVCRQIPGPSSTVKEGRKIRLIISKGVEVGVAPDLSKKTLTEAKETLKKAELELGNVKVEYAEGEKPDVVLSQSIKAKEKVASNTKIDLVVNISAKQTVVPNVVGKTIEEVKKLLQEKGLTLGAVVKEESKEKVDSIIGSSPKVGAICDKGTAVDIKTAIAPPPEKDVVKIVEFVVPGDSGKQDVQIVVTNDAGKKSIYSGSVDSKARLRQQVEVKGNTSVQFYIGGNLVEDRKI